MVLPRQPFCFILSHSHTHTILNIYIYLICRYIKQRTGVVKTWQHARVRENCVPEPRDSKTNEIFPTQSKPYQDWLKDCRIENKISPPPDAQLGVYRDKTLNGLKTGEKEYMGKLFPFNGDNWSPDYLNYVRERERERRTERKHTPSPHLP